MSPLRRHFSFCLLFSATGSLAPVFFTSVLQAEETNPQSVTFEWRVPPNQRETVEASLKYQGSIREDADNKGFPLVLIIAGVALLPNLAKSIIALRNKLTKPGIIIDARGKNITIETSTSLPKGYILLTDKSGSRLFDAEEIKEPAELGALLSTALSK